MPALQHVPCTMSLRSQHHNAPPHALKVWGPVSCLRNTDNDDRNPAPWTRVPGTNTGHRSSSANHRTREKHARTQRQKREGRIHTGSGGAHLKWRMDGSWKCYLNASPTCSCSTLGRAGLLAARTLGRMGSRRRRGRRPGRGSAPGTRAARPWGRPASAARAPSPPLSSPCSCAATADHHPFDASL